MVGLKLWNWEQDDWPDFRFDPRRLAALEERFLQESGVYSGSVKHLEKDGRDLLVVEFTKTQRL